MLNILNTITAGSVIFLAFLILSVRRDANRAANGWLALFLVLLGIFLLDDTLVIYGIYDEYPQLLGIAFLPAWAFAPVLFFCVSAFVSIGWAFRWRDLWHFLPFVLFFLKILPYLMLPGAVKLHELAEEKTSGLEAEDKIMLCLLAFQVLAYLFFSLRKLRQHRKHLETITASPEGFRLHWLLYFLLCFGALMLFWLGELFVPRFTHDGGWQTFIYFLAVYALAFFALRQKEVFPFSQKSAQEIKEFFAEDDLSTTAKRSLLSEERLIQMKSSLLENMKSQKPYLDPDLTLPSLAGQMNLSLNELSELVNNGFGENFNQFINRYRVEESKRLLASEKHGHLSMVGIAYEAGFNSKTAFNMAFKKMTGGSPTEFKNEAVATFS
ncbi:MAG: helix-turn-helix domain-containing protein [Saprospiraceae bacterium]